MIFIYFQYFSGDWINPDVQGGHVLCIRHNSNSYRVLVEQSKGERPLGMSRHVWESSSKNSLESCRIDSSKFSSSIKCWEWLDSEDLLSFQERFCSVELFACRSKASLRMCVQNYWNISYSPLSISWCTRHDYIRWSLYRNYYINFCIIFRNQVIGVPLGDT